MTPTPEELARLPDFDGKRIIDHYDDGLSWTWKSDKGHSLWPMDDDEKALLSMLLTDRRTLERYRGALESVKVVNDAADEWAMTTVPIPSMEEQTYRWADDLDKIGEIVDEALSKEAIE